ncbi:MAG: Ig-like domain-containing protein [Nocardioidaceae bacterium]
MTPPGRTGLLRHLSRRRSITAAIAASVVVLSACTPSSGDSTDDPTDDSAASPVSAGEPDTSPDSLSVNVDDNEQGVTVDTVVKAAAADGTLRNVTVYRGRKPSDDTRIGGAMSEDKTSWVAADLLEPGETYHVVAKGENTDGQAETMDTRFTTEALTLDQQTYPSVFPLQGQTVGVGIPIIVTFDIPVDRRAVVEKRLEVTSKPRVEGSWSWTSDSEVRYRPKSYWPAGTDVQVTADVNGVDVGNGIYGQESRDVGFSIGSSRVSTVDVANQTLTVRSGGEVVRTLPVTSGKAGFATRGGTKVIMEKYVSKRMDAATTGIDRDDPEYYNISNVRYAMRVTNSGEFIHAAPWSVGSQGTANVSHGCVGMSTSNARWFYGSSQIGDVVKFVNSSRTLEQGNGWTDWDESYQDFKAGSALT